MGPVAQATLRLADPQFLRLPQKAWGLRHGKVDRYAFPGLLSKDGTRLSIPRFYRGGDLRQGELPCRGDRNPLLGLARAFGDHFVDAKINLSFIETAVWGNPVIVKASAVLIMAIVLLVRSAGILGKKE